MLDENNLVTYAFSDEWYSVDAARRTMRRMYEAINRGDLKLSTVLNPAHDCIYHTFGVLTASNYTDYSIVREEA